MNREDNFSETAMAVHAEVENRVRANPYLAVAAGVGAGVVLGGGVPSWALRLAAHGLGRVAVAYVLAQLAEDVVE